MRGSLRTACEKDEENHLRCTCCAGGSFGPVLKVYQTLLDSLCLSVHHAFVASPRPPPLIHSSTRYRIPDGPSHDNCPSTVFRLSSFAFGGNDPAARVRAIGSVPVNCELLAIVLLIRETLLKRKACNPTKKINNSNYKDIFYAL